MIPVTTELFIQAADGSKFAVCRKFKREKSLASSFTWIRPRNSSIAKLLTNGTYSFPDACIVEDQVPDALFHIRVSEIQTKGFCVEHGKQHFILPLGNFDHD